MKAVVTFTLALLLMAAPAFADSFHIGGTENITNQGGAGGAGGSASSSAAATATSTTTIHNSNQQLQGQIQGQSQRQGQSQIGINAQGQNNDQTIAPSQSVKIDGTSFDRYAPTVVAPGLTAAGTGVCLGSVAIGLSGPMAGLSFGITKVDSGCEQRSAAALLWQFGYKDAAVRLLMNNEEVKAAMGADGAKLAIVPVAAPVVAAGSAVTAAPVVKASDSAPSCNGGKPARLTSAGFYTCY